MDQPHAKESLEKLLIAMAVQRANEARTAWEAADGIALKQQTFDYYFKRLQIIHRIASGMFSHLLERDR